MTENPDNQSNITSRLSKGLKTSQVIILVAFLSLYAMCICGGLIDTLGSRYFNLISVIPLILFVSLGLTIFLVFWGRERLSSQLAKVSPGLILILLAMISSYFVVGITNFFLHDFLYRDSGLYYILTVFIISMLVSLWYFSDQKFQRRSVVSIHAIVAVLFMVFFVFQYANVRKNQALVLQAYYELSLSQPTKGLSVYSVEYNFWSNEAYVIADSHFTPIPTFWERPTDGVSYQFEFIDGQWEFTGITHPYFID